MHPGNIQLPDRVGPYILGECLGRGGMGEVYRARDERLDREVALKRIRDDYQSPRRRERFLREARAAARVGHAGVVQVFDIVEENDCLWIVMELAEGEDLAQVIERRSLSLEDALAIADQVAAGLEAAHRQGLVHRDLKSENIILAEHGIVKILDFGMAKSLLPNNDPTVSVDGQLLGTPRAMAPEQALGLPVDARADLFSFGVLLYELSSGGESPFGAPTALATLTRVCNLPHDPLSELAPDLPHSLVALVDDLLSKEVDLRPASATEVRERLHSLVAEIQGRPGLRISRATQRPRSPEDSAETLRGDRTAATGSDRHTTERRQVTVLICTLVGDQRGSTTPDPEVLYGAIGDFQKIARAAVASYEGHLPKSDGHRLIAYFGYPRAHEDDARRAVYAGLEILEGLLRAPLDAPRHRLGARLGIHTGPAITTHDGAEGLILGPTLDLAHEACHSGPSGVVRLSSMTRRLVRDFFDLEAAEEAASDGSQLYRVRGAKAAESRLHLPAASPLIARQKELETLVNHLAKARSSAGRGALVMGEAGIGKSRLVQGLHDLAGPDPRWLAVFASPYATRTPFFPLTGLVRRLLGMDAETPAERQREGLVELVTELGLAVEETVPTLARLLGLADTEGAPVMAPDQLKKWTFEVLIALVSMVAQRRPTVLLVEDLHWADPSTLEWLERLIDRLPQLPLLFLATCRLDFDIPWRQRGHLTRLVLQPLSSKQVDQLISTVARGQELPKALRRLIVEKSDGVPLFVEEMTKAVLEAQEKGDGEQGDGLQGDGLQGDGLPTVPTTLRDSLTSRLDRLGPAKAVAQLAAVIGREVPFALLKEVWQGPEDELETELDRLLEAELIFEKGFLSRRAFLFKHALVQDAAYNSLLLAERQSNHGNIARALEHLAASSSEVNPSLLAHHWAAAGEPERALPFCLMAGEQALSRAALVEARGLFEKGLELLPEATLAENAVGQLELKLLNGLALVLMSSEGPGSANLLRVWSRARKLGEHLDLPQDLAQSLFGLWMIRLTHRQLEMAGELADACEHLARRLVDPVVELHAHLAQGNTRFWLGDFRRTREHVGRARKLLGPEQEASYASRYGQNPRVHTVMFHLYAAFFLGQGSRALEMHRELEALVGSEDLGVSPDDTEAAGRPERGILRHPYNRAIGLQALTIHGFHLDRPAEVGRLATRLQVITEEHGFPLFRGIAYIFQGWAEALDGDAEGIEKLRRGYHEHTAPAGGLVIHTLYCLLLAQALEACQKSSAALEALEDGLRGARHGSLWDPYTVELLRLKARLLGSLEADKPGDPAEGSAEDPASPTSERQQALDIARLQGSPLLELRARLDLWLDRGGAPDPASGPEADPAQDTTAGSTEQGAAIETLVLELERSGGETYATDLEAARQALALG